jgi:squalene-hopene/tetraprenyl-beta-curcumene cyclase
MHRGDILVVEDGSEKSTDLHGRVAKSMERARNCLLEMQTREGYWVGELEADASVTAGYIPLMFYMTGRVDQETKKKVIRLVTGKQKQDGSWSCYFDGPGDINVSIQCYFALKLGGLSFHDPRMEQARRFILEKGGIIKANTLTKIWLALFGQYKWQGTPSVPPEIILLPDWFYLNIYEFASWSRATLVALMVVLSKRSVCKVPDSANIFELYVESVDRRDYSLGKVEKLFSWKRFFLLLDSLLKIYEKLPFKPVRRIALDAAERWIVAHQESDGSWGGLCYPGSIRSSL